MQETNYKFSIQSFWGNVYTTREFEYLNIQLRVSG